MLMKRNDGAKLAPTDDIATLLPLDFSPGPNHVVCHRGKIFWEHEGNKKYRSIIESATAKYAACANKHEKSLIVSDIVNSIHNTQPKGGFVKKDGNGRWVEADEIFSREKVGQSLRDSLHSQYRSSTKAKKRRKTVIFETASDVVDQVIHSNRQVSNRIRQLETDFQRQSKTANEEAVSSLFNQANLGILETIKQDSQLRYRFQQATFLASATVSKESAYIKRSENKKVSGTKRKEMPIGASRIENEKQIENEKRIRFNEKDDGT